MVNFFKDGSRGEVGRDEERDVEPRDGAIEPMRERERERAVHEKERRAHSS